MGHARLSPSSADRWCNCPGSVNLCSKVPPRPGGKYAMEGTAAHKLLEWAIVEGKDPAVYPDRQIEVRCDVTKEVHKFTVDREMIDAVNVALDWLKGVLEIDPDAVVYSERKVNPGALMGRDDCKGTADITVLTPTKVRLADYKHGAGKFVEVEDNLQELLYIIGCLEDIPVERRKDIEEVEITVIQPRYVGADPVRSKTYTVGEIWNKLFWFTQRAKATDDPEAPLKPGDWCTFCDAKPSCPKLRQRSIDVFGEVDIPGVVNKAVQRPPEALTKEEQLLIKREGDMIISFIKAVQAHVDEQFKNGEDYPGLKLVNGRDGNRAWVGEMDETIRYLNSAFGLKKDEVTQVKLLGPSKVIAMAKKSEKASPKKLKNLEAKIHRPPGGVVVAFEDDKRPAIQRKSSEVFANVPTVGEQSCAPKPE